MALLLSYMSVLNRSFERIRQPEYTGENRCMPCTIVNSIIAVVLAVIAGLLWLPAAFIVIAIAAASIVLRGYLIPGTPELTQQYLPESVLRAFGKEEIVDESTDTQAVDSEEAPELEEVLLAADVVEECADVDDLCLTESFGSSWWSSIQDLRADDQRSLASLATVIEADVEELSFEDNGQFSVLYEGDIIARWDSKAMFLADLAARPLLEQQVTAWESLGDHERTGLIAGMRAFLDACPMCEATLEQVEDVRKSCCGNSLTKVSVECEECESVIFSGSYR